MLNPKATASFIFALFPPKSSSITKQTGMVFHVFISPAAASLLAPPGESGVPVSNPLPRHSDSIPSSVEGHHVTGPCHQILFTAPISGSLDSLVCPLLKTRPQLHLQCLDR